VEMHFCGEGKVKAFHRVGVDEAGIITLPFLARSERAAGASPLRDSKGKQI